MGCFETEVLTEPDPVYALLDFWDKWVDRVRQRKPTRECIMDLDSSVSETYSTQKGAAYIARSTGRGRLMQVYNHCYA